MRAREACEVVCGSKDEASEHCLFGEPHVSRSVRLKLISTIIGSVVAQGRDAKRLEFNRDRVMCIGDFS